LSRYIKNLPQPVARLPKHSTHLSAAQDIVLADEICRLIRWNLNPSHGIVWGFANRLLYKAFDPGTDKNTELPTVGQNWPACWLQHYPEFESDWSKPIDKGCLLATNKEGIKKYFDKYKAI
jgi:hypothetical protein